MEPQAVNHTLHVTDLLPWINILIVPLVAFIYRIDIKLTRLEQRDKDLQGQRNRRCPIETGRCPIVRQRYRTSWIEPVDGAAWAQTEEKAE